MCIGQHVPTNAESLFVWKARLLWGKGAPSSLAPFFNCLILSTNFGQPKTWPVCRFRYCFLDICIRTIQLKHEGWGCFWTTASHDIFVGFNPLTILSGQGHISELVVQAGKKQCHCDYCTNACAHSSDLRWHKDSKRPISMLPVASVTTKVFASQLLGLHIWIELYIL